MKILLTGGGTGGHFYPIIAVAEQLKEVSKARKLLAPEIYYMAPTPYSPRALFEAEIIFKPVSAGKVRRYFSILNFTDLFKTGFGLIGAIWTLYWIYPDVVFGKGGYVSFPGLFAARILGIPVVIHESDSKPGRVNLWAGKFARRIALSYPEASKYFPPDKTALTGNPVRSELTHPVTSGAHEYLELEKNIPTIFILGGSQGSKNINEALLDALPLLVTKYQIIHQTGPANFQEVKETAKVVLEMSDFKQRYKPFDYLNTVAMRMSAGAADLVISRAGSTIFEIALWGVPSIIIPIPESVSHDQLSNAFCYAATGAATVIEENNLTTEILISEIEKILENPILRQKMKDAARAFAKPDAAKKIAEQILDIALTHETA
jgi:UDP-N-acetylglucosamine--N-acetylmuramyl-(pentapeptide) pyrophosphoryl-undecaprenol N-acetylglucosamine transferase